MHSAATWSVTPRPMYPADGRKIPDIYTQPAELRDELNARARASSRSSTSGGRRPTSRRAAGSPTARSTCYDTKRPTLTLVYLPHLDYNLQRLGPARPARSRRTSGRSTRSAGELIDAGAAGRDAGRRAVRVRHHAGDRRRPRESRPARGGAAPRPDGARAESSSTPAPPRPSRSRTTRSRTSTCAGPERGAGGQAPAARDCPASSACSTRTASAPRASTTRARASWSPSRGRDRWFTYYYWLDDARAPDFARTVDIHRKPGYDPVELFLDPALRGPQGARSAGGSPRRPSASGT